MKLVTKQELLNCSDPVGALFEENTLKQITKFYMSLNDRCLIKRINRIKYRINIFTRERNV